MKKIIQAGILAIALLLLFVSGYAFNSSVAEESGSTAFGREGSSQVMLVSPQDGEEVSLITEPVKDYIDHVRTDFAETDIADYTNEGVEEDVMVPVVFQWESGKTTCTLELATSPDFSNQRTWQTDLDEIAVGYLQANQTYYWRIAHAGERSETRSFQTADYPVLLSVDGITNVRDIGGYNTDDGKVVKQGMLFRGSEMNRDYTISSSGIDTMKDILHIKTDLDLRRDTQTGEGDAPLSESPLGEDVTYLNLPILSYDSLMKDKNPYDLPVRENLLIIFSEVLTNPDNYPIYLHCQHGADRTGCLCFIIEGMLGVSYEDMVMDYELTNFSIYDRGRNSSDEHVREFYEFQELLKRYGAKDASWQTICTNYLKEFVGVSQKDIDKIRDLLTE